MCTGTTPEGTSDSLGGGGGSGNMRPPQQSFEKLECQVVVLKAIALYIRYKMASHYDTKSNTNYVKTNSDHQSARFMI